MKSKSLPVSERISALLVELSKNETGTRIARFAIGDDRKKVSKYRIRINVPVPDMPLRESKLPLPRIDALIELLDKEDDVFRRAFLIEGVDTHRRAAEILHRARLLQEATDDRYDIFIAVDDSQAGRLFSEQDFFCVPFQYFEMRGFGEGPGKAQFSLQVNWQVAA